MGQIRIPPSPPFTSLTGVVTLQQNKLNGQLPVCISFPAAREATHLQGGVAGAGCRLTAAPPASVLRCPSFPACVPAARELDRPKFQKRLSTACANTALP